MASDPDAMSGRPPKGIHETSVTAIPRQYELDGIDDEIDDNHAVKSVKSPGYTRNDRRDMDRMGKTQELRVSKHCLES